jgi:hypothetical protein
MSDERKVRQQRREARVIRRGQLEQLVKFMQDPHGRKYIYDLLASVGIYSTTFSANALTMAFREGERNIGLRLVADLTEASPELYLMMLKEAGNERSAQSDEPDGTDATESDSDT